MSSLPSIPELIGLVVAVALALAFVSYLLYIRGMEAGLGRARIRRTLVAVWGVVFGLLALLMGLRVVVGAPLIEGSPTEGISAAHMTPVKWLLTALAIVLVAAGGLWLRNTVQAFEPRPAVTLVETDSSPDSDQTC